MSLDYWAEQGWIEEIEVSGNDIRQLLNLARRNIDEALESTHSDDWKFNILYAALVNISSCALRACGYRVKSAGSHYYLIESLSLTMELDRDIISLLDSYRKKRNIITYELEGCVSDKEVAEMEEFTNQLLKMVENWLHEKHPDLLLE